MSLMSLYTRFMPRFRLQGEADDWQESYRLSNSRLVTESTRSAINAHV